MARTRVSSKGQLIVPKAVRDRHGWSAGTEIEVEDRGDVVVLRRAEPLFPPTTIDQVRGSAKYEGPPIPMERWNDGIDAMMREMWEEFEKQPR
jgi:AbrB family looped-hinge helix DNA binding protein